MRSIANFFTASIQRKILFSFTTVIVLISAMVSGGFYQLNQVRNIAAEIPEDSSQLAEAQNFILALTSLETNLERFFVVGGGQFREDINRDLEVMATAFEAREESFDEDENQTITEMEEKFNTLTNEVSSLVGAGYAELSSREINEKIISIYSQIDSLKELAQKLSTIELSQMQESALQQESTTANVIIQFLILGSLAILVVVGASSIVTRNIARPLAQLAKTATQIATGDLNAQSPVIVRPDEVGQLTVAFNSMTAQLREVIGSLEQRVAARTHRLEIVASLGERLLSILNPNELLDEVVNQIKDNFDYYHSHIYLLDDKGENLVVAAGTGEAGAEMKARGHSITLDAPTSLVARAARSRETVKVDNVRETADWLPNPLLPDTYSEMAVPIILEERVVGVLDVQEDKIAGLDEGDASLLHSLVNLIAVTMRNARLFDEVETALAEAYTAQERYVEQSWKKSKMVTRGGQYHYAPPEAPPLSKTILAKIRQQAQKGNSPRIVDLDDNTPDEIPESPAEQTPGEERKPEAIVAPIILHNRTIGDLQLYRTDADQAWTEDDIAITEAVINQLAQTAENLRLFEETRERVNREQILREITEKIRAATSLDNLIKTAAQELGQRFSSEYTWIELGIETEAETQTRVKNGH